MLTIKELIPENTTINETEFAQISDRLWEIGSLKDIQEQVSPELFSLHIGLNIIGSWRDGGWWYILCEQADLVPYIPTVLEQLNLPGLKAAFENILKIFPEFTVFQSGDSTYCDIVNFLQNTHIKVQDERLRCIAPEKRKNMVSQIRQQLDRLEDLTEPVWGAQTECAGWKTIFDYISACTE